MANEAQCDTQMQGDGSTNTAGPNTKSLVDQAKTFEPHGFYRQKQAQLFFLIWELYDSISSDSTVMGNLLQ